MADPRRIEFLHLTLPQIDDELGKIRLMRAKHAWQRGACRERNGHRGDGESGASSPRPATTGRVPVRLHDQRRQPVHRDWLHVDLAAGDGQGARGESNLTALHVP